MFFPHCRLHIITNKMLSNFDHTDDLLTPIMTYGGVNILNPMLPSSDILSLDDNDICFSSSSPEKNEYRSISVDSTNGSTENNQQQQDLFSTFDFPVLSELSRTDLQLDGIEFDKYLNQVSLPSPPLDGPTPSASDDSTFYPVDDSTSLWVGEECTVESNKPEDMIVPPSPPLSSVPCSPAGTKKETTRKSHLSTNERKLRKKDQNKTAAEKYRLKKRTERDELTTRHSDLKNQNQELKYEFENVKFQLEQFKQLFVDVLQIPIPSNKSQ